MKKIRDKHIILTGGAGFIGSHIYELLYKDNDVRVIDDLSAGRYDNLPERAIVDVFDLSNPSSWEDEHMRTIIGGADVIIDCAAQVSTFESMIEPRKDFQINGYGKMMLLDSIRRFGKDPLVIYTSSRSVHGDIQSSNIADETFPFKLHSMYNLDKFYIENALKVYHEINGMKYVIIRPANVYGPRMPNKGLYGFLNRWISYVLTDRPIPIWGLGDQIRDFTYVTDIAKAYPMVIDNSKALGQAYLLCNGVETTLMRLACQIFDSIEKPVNLTFLSPKKGDIQRFVGSYNKAKNDLGWVPEVTLFEGLKLTIDWVKKNIDRYKEYNLT